MKKNEQNEGTLRSVGYQYKLINCTYTKNYRRYEFHLNYIVCVPICICFLDSTHTRS